MGWYQRVDRFWLLGEEHAVHCNGVFTVDLPTETVYKVRDYVDLGEWRARVRPVLEALAAKSVEEVILQHLSSLATGDPVAITSDYAIDAVMSRPDAKYGGWCEIADYFESVQECLKGRQIIFGDLEIMDDNSAKVAWEIMGADELLASGQDVFVVTGGKITHQRTSLESDDF